MSWTLSNSQGFWN
uniref:Uncharacterized protein n=1 Tax=Salix viminalis TaxID=40686 RepID=A0A6N2K7E8_SALVM